MKLAIMPPMNPVSIDIGSLESCVCVVDWSRAFCPMSEGSSIRSIKVSKRNCG